jgi:gliding motility-associated-like protein
VIALPTVNAGRDTTIMVGTGFVLQPTYTGSNLQYRWTPGQYLSCADCANPTVTPKEPMEYSINVRNAFGCESNDRIRIELLCNGESVFLPNTFTPNGDGVNDIWYPRGSGIRQVKSLKVFNRWGQSIFERTNFNTDDRTAGWDGTYKGQPLPPDVFVFTMAADLR